MNFFGRFSTSHLVYYISTGALATIQATSRVRRSEMASRIPEEDVPKYESLLNDGKAKLTSLRSWREREDTVDRTQFENELQQTLDFCKAAFGIFRDDKQFHR